MWTTWMRWRTGRTARSAETHTTKSGWLSGRLPMDAARGFWKGRDFGYLDEAECLASSHGRGNWISMRYLGYKFTRYLGGEKGGGEEEGDGLLGSIPDLPASRMFQRLLNNTHTHTPRGIITAHMDGWRGSFFCLALSNVLYISLCTRALRASPLDDGKEMEFGHSTQAWWPRADRVHNLGLLWPC